MQIEHSSGTIHCEGKTSPVVIDREYDDFHSGMKRWVRWFCFPNRVLAWQAVSSCALAVKWTCATCDSGFVRYPSSTHMLEKLTSSALASFITWLISIFLFPISSLSFFYKRLPKGKTDWLGQRAIFVWRRNKAGRISPIGVAEKLPNQWPIPVQILIKKRVYTMESTEWYKFRYESNFGMWRQKKYHS